MTFSLDLLRGGPTRWAVDVADHRYFNEIIDITGLTQKCGFSGEMESATVTVSLARCTILPPVGAKITIFFNGSPLWNGLITELNERAGHRLDIIAKGYLSFKQDSFEYYNAKASTPALAIDNWLSSATGASIPLFFYRDGHYRSYAQVAPPAMTLSGLLPLTYSFPNIIGYKAVYDKDSRQWKKHGVDFGTTSFAAPIIEVNTFSPNPSGERDDPTAIKSGLQWHRKNDYIELQGRFGYTDNPAYGSDTPPRDCDWYVGGDKYVSFASLYTRNNSVHLYNAETEPESTGSYRLRQYNRNRTLYNNWFTLALGFFGIMPLGRFYDYRRVNAGVYKGSSTSEASSLAQAFSHDDSFIAEADSIVDSMDFSEALVGSAFAPSDHDFGAAIDFKYVHPSTMGWTFSNFANAMPYDQYVEYAIRQRCTLSTISQYTWTEELVKQAMVVGGIGVVEQCVDSEEDDAPVSDIQEIDLYPETGRIFDVPISDATCYEWEKEQDNPLPGLYHISWLDQCGNEFNVDYCPAETNGVEQDIKILNGFAGGDQETRVELLWYGTHEWYHGFILRSGSNPGPYASKVLPGTLLDRFSGVYHIENGSDGGTLGLRPSVPYDAYREIKDGQLIFPNSAGYKYGFKYLGTDGHVYTAMAIPGQHQAADYGNRFVPDTDHAVRDANGNNICLFGNILVMLTTDYFETGDSKKFKDGLLDIFPLESTRSASQRTYKLPNRPTYTCKVSHVFATAPVGSVVMLKTSLWQSGEAWLALILGKSFGAHEPVTLTVAPMRPMSECDPSAWSNWNNLQSLSFDTVFPHPAYAQETESRVFPLTSWTGGGVSSFYTVVQRDAANVIKDLPIERISLQFVRDNTIYSLPCVARTPGADLSFLSSSYGGARSILLAYSNNMLTIRLMEAFSETFLADYLNADGSYKEGCLIQLVIDDTNTYDLPPLPPPPPTPTWHLISGTEVTPTKSGAQYYSCHQFEVNGSTRLSATLDLTKGLFVEINGEAFFSPSFEGSLKTVLNASNGFPRATTSSWTTSYPNNWGAGGVYLVNNRSRSVQEWYLTDEMYEKFSNDEVTIRVWYNAEAELY